MDARTESFDVVVIGAGAAGPAAVAEFCACGKCVCVLEARDRIGGRIFTRREPGPARAARARCRARARQPAATLGWLAGRTALVDAPCERFVLRGGKLVQGNNLFPELKARVKNMPRPRRDLPFGEFLARPAREHLPPRPRELAFMLVEGYDAAEATRVSMLATIAEWCGPGAADADTFRPEGGYAALLESLARNRDAERVHVRLGAVVREVGWNKSNVAVTRSGTAPRAPRSSRCRSACCSCRPTRRTPCVSSLRSPQTSARPKGRRRPRREAAAALPRTVREQLDGGR